MTNTLSKPKGFAPTPLDSLFRPLPVAPIQQPQASAATALRHSGQTLFSPISLFNAGLFKPHGALPQGRNCDCRLPSDDENDYFSDDDLEVKAVNPCCGKPPPGSDTEDENDDWDLGLSEDEKEEYHDGNIAAHFQESKTETAKISSSEPQRNSFRLGASQVPGAGWAIKKQKTNDNCNGCDDNAPTKAKAEAVKKGAKAADLKDKAYGKKSWFSLSRYFLLSIQEDQSYFYVGFISF